MCSITQLCPTLCDPKDCSLPGFSDPGDYSPGKNTGVGCQPSSRGSSQPGIEPKSLQVDSLPAELLQNISSFCLVLKYHLETQGQV